MQATFSIIRYYIKSQDIWKWASRIEDGFYCNSESTHAKSFRWKQGLEWKLDSKGYILYEYVEESKDNQIYLALENLIGKVIICKKEWWLVCNLFSWQPSGP